MMTSHINTKKLAQKFFDFELFGQQIGFDTILSVTWLEYDTVDILYPCIIFFYGLFWTTAVYTVMVMELWTSHVNKFCH